MVVKKKKNISTDLKIVFMGTPEIAADVLEKLLSDNLRILAVITRPDKPKGRGNKITKSPVKILAEEKKISVFEPKTKAELTEALKKLKPDLGIIAAYGMIIPKEALDIPKYGIINFHPSLLPLYRGPDPVSMPIICGEKETGVSIIAISEGMDEGDILAQEKYKLTGKETTPELEKKLAIMGVKMLKDLIPKYVSGKIIPKPQEHDRTTYTHLVKKEDARLCWDRHEAKGMEQMGRAFTPWPGIYSFWNGKKIDFYDISVIDGNFVPGLVIEKDGMILIGTKKGAISPTHVKLEGKGKTATNNFVRGYPAFIGSNLIGSGEVK